MAQKDQQTALQSMRESILGLSFLAWIAVAVVLPLRGCTLLREASVKPAPDMARAMGKAFSHPMITSTIEFPDMNRKEGDVDVGRTIFGGRVRSWGTLEVEQHSRVLIPHAEAPPRLRIQYRNGIRNALGRGKWRGNSASVRLEGAVEDTFPGEPGNPNGKWGLLGSVSSRGRTVTPYFRVTVPFDRMSTEQAISKRLVSLTAVLSVTSPGSVAGGGWRDFTGERTGHLECLLLSPSETQTYRRLQRAHFRAVALRTVPLYGGGFLVWLAIPIALLSISARKGSRESTKRGAGNASGVTKGKRSDGRTLLHLGASLGNKDAVALLIAQGADVNARDGNGHTPLSLAREEGHREIVELLRRHGGRE